jgi:hypothetical protein
LLLPGRREPTSETRSRDVATKEAGDAVQVKRLIRRHIRRVGSGIDLAADVNAVVSVNVNEHGHATTSATSTTGAQSPPATGRDADGLDNRGRENA